MWFDSRKATKNRQWIVSGVYVESTSDRMGFVAITGTLAEFHFLEVFEAAHPPFEARRLGPDKYSVKAKFLICPFDLGNFTCRGMVAPWKNRCFILQQNGVCREREFIFRHSNGFIRQALTGIFKLRGLAFAPGYSLCPPGFRASPF